MELRSKRGAAAVAGVVVAAGVNVTTGMLTQHWAAAWWAATAALVVVGGGLQLWLTVQDDPSAIEDLDSASKRLAERVRSDLETQIGRLGLSRPVPIAVRWSSTGRPVQGPASVVANIKRRLAGDVTQLSGLMRELPRRQLMVLGEPGAGKSVAALLLARDLVCQLDGKEPVPVVLSLSSWRPEVDLHSWIAKHILALCPDLAAGYGRDIAERLVSQARVMPVLDGLDELPRPLHAQAVEAIDRAVADGVPLLVTCRGAEYERVVTQGCQHLTRAAVVELEPIEADTATEFLQASYPEKDTRWAPVFERLRSEPGSSLGRALSSPLMLYLARTAYRSGAKDPQELLNPARFGSQAAVEGHLLEIFIPTVYAKSRDVRYRPGPVERWLRFMADRMRHDNTVDFTWTQVRSPVPVLLSALLSGVVLGWFAYLLFGLLVGVPVMIGVAAISSIPALLHFLGVHEPDETYGDLKSVLHRHGFADLLVSSVIAGAVLLGVWYWLHSKVGVTSGIAWKYGIVVGVGFGVAILLGTSWGIYTVSQVWFWLTGRLPWRLTGFFEEAHRLGVLRLAGPAYQFRHVRLLEQLSDTTWTSGSPKTPEPEEMAERWNWWRPFLTNLPLAVIGLILVLIMAGAVVGSSGDALEYQSGDKPSIGEPVCGLPQGGADIGGGGGGTCVGNFTLTWQLHPGSSIRTLLGPPYYERNAAAGTATEIGIQTLTGELAANGCAQASVQVTITISGLHLRSFVMGLESRTARALAPLPRKIYGNPLAEITLRRIDARPCTLRFVWTDPGVSYDAYGHVRQRLSQ